MPIAIVFGIIAFAALLIYKRRHPCNWQRTGGQGNLKEFTCKHCGVTACSARYDGPQECKRATKQRPL